jgi:DNA primase
LDIRNQRTFFPTQNKFAQSVCVSLANGILDSKTQTVLTTSGGKTTHFMSPIGPLQLTAEECNEILMKRAAAAVAANNQHAITTTTDGHHGGNCEFFQWQAC